MFEDRYFGLSYCSTFILRSYIFMRVTSKRRPLDIKRVCTRVLIL